MSENKEVVVSEFYTNAVEINVSPFELELRAMVMDSQGQPRHGINIRDAYTRFPKVANAMMGVGMVLAGYTVYKDAMSGGDGWGQIAGRAAISVGAEALVFGAAYIGGRAGAYVGKVAGAGLGPKGMLVGAVAGAGFGAAGFTYMFSPGIYYGKTSLYQELGL